MKRSWRIGASLCDRKDGEHSCPSSTHKRRRRCRLPPAGNSDSALECPGAEAVSGWPGGKATCSIRCTWRSRFSAGYSISSFRGRKHGWGRPLPGDQRRLRPKLWSSTRPHLAGRRRERRHRDRPGRGRAARDQRLARVGGTLARRAGARERPPDRQLGRRGHRLGTGTDARPARSRGRERHRGPPSRLTLFLIAREARPCSPLLLQAREHRVAAPPESSTIRPPASSAAITGLATTPRPERPARASASRASRPAGIRRRLPRASSHRARCGRTGAGRGGTRGRRGGR